MLKYLKNVDSFSKNIIIVFSGTVLVNIFNLLTQLVIAHRLTANDFAAFNSLLSIFVLLSTPLATLQTVVVKYTAEFNAQNQLNKVKFLLSSLLKKTFILAVLTFIIFYFVSLSLIDKLKINSTSAAYILTLLLAFSWLGPVFSGGLQGLELFKWLMAISLIGGFAKLLFAFIFTELGFTVSGASGAFLASSVIGLALSAFALRRFIYFKTEHEQILWKELILYIFPVAISTFCFAGLTNIDMVLVRYYFSPADSGAYSIAQMVGKIFLFLPAAINLVMFPKTSGLNANQKSSTHILNRSLLYAAILCILASVIYNAMPVFVLKVLTGKALSESVVLGRLFSISMSFFALSFIIMSYFLSIKDLRFVKYLALFSCIQILAIVFLHHSLIQVQAILCINAIIIFFIYLIMAQSRRR